MATTGGYLRRLTRRLTEDLEQVDAEKIGDDAAATGAQRVIDFNAAKKSPCAAHCVPSKPIPRAVWPA
ncbi:ATP-dependent DNA helicase RecG [Mycobacteroides abscessus]|nr:ATP-dependent DNA helicase RecG [Mycobacteroides abscessus]